jgi:hypothetical protein
MVFMWRIPTMIGKRRVRIKTHAAFRVGIGVLFAVILSNNPQISDFLNISQSERFVGFFRIKKRIIGARFGVILLEGEYSDHQNWEFQVLLVKTEYLFTTLFDQSFKKIVLVLSASSMKDYRNQTHYQKSHSNW